MDDYRGKLCVLDGEYLAKCIEQDFITGTLTFEIEPNGETFTREGDFGVGVYKDGDLTFDDIKHLLPRVNEEN